jgi:fucose permease
LPATRFQKQKRYNTRVPQIALCRALLGFFVSGVLLSFLGAILPAWGHHLRSSFDIIGHHFLALVVGTLAAVPVARSLVHAKGVRLPLIAGCGVGCAALVYLSFVPPPAPDILRILGLVFVGGAAGLINTAVFYASSAEFRANAAVNLSLAGAAFGLGCLTTTLLAAITFHGYSPAVLLIALAGTVAASGLYFMTGRIPLERPPDQPQWRELLPQFMNPSAVLFSLLLFFQFGNEWAIAGWLPLFLIQRVGVSPASALLVLAVYWSALLAGRLAAQWWLARVSHWKLLMGSGAGAVFGCGVLAATNNLFGASIAAVVMGFSFAAIYPLVAEKIGNRFPTYHPGIFNGVFSFALTGGILAPAHLGYLAEWLGIGVVALLPVLGTCMVLLLTVLIWVESRFGSPQPHTQRS